MGRTVAGLQAQVLLPGRPFRAFWIVQDHTLSQVHTACPSSPFNVSMLLLSLVQLKTSLAARQRSLPGQIEEETHQLAFVQKNLASLLSLLADTNSAGEEVSALQRRSRQDLSS